MFYTCTLEKRGKVGEEQRWGKPSGETDTERMNREQKENCSFATKNL